jgi:hypothetical protein
MTPPSGTATVNPMPRTLPADPLFATILCGADNLSGGVVARRHAGWLAEPDADLDIVPASSLLQDDRGALAERCEDYDLLVLPDSDSTRALVGEVPIPVLLARWCLYDRDLTDEILVAASTRAGAERAAELAARLARSRGGSVTVVAAPRRSPELARAIAASSRIIFSTAGKPPRVLGEAAPPEISIQRAAVQIGASLLVVAVGGDAWDAALVADVARFAGCSVLTVPAPVRLRTRFTRADAGHIAWGRCLAPPRAASAAGIA